MSIQCVGQGGQVNYSIQEAMTSENSGKVHIQEVQQESHDELNEKSADNVTKKLNGVISDYGVHAVYEKHEKLNDIMVKIVDDKTGQVISEIPPKKILDMIAKFCEMAGIIVDKKA